MACPMSALQREMFRWPADGLNVVICLNALVMHCRGELPPPLVWRTSIHPLGVLVKHPVPIVQSTSYLTCMLTSVDSKCLIQFKLMHEDINEERYQQASFARSTSTIGLCAEQQWATCIPYMLQAACYCRCRLRYTS